MSLAKHRAALLLNPERYEQGFQKARLNWIKHSYNYYRVALKTNREKSDLKQHLGLMADAVFDAQMRRPLFEIDDRCFAWNSPRDFNYNYIKYEIGHINPIDKGGHSSVDNLCFQSARCNQHIQSALSLADVEFLIGHHESIAARLLSLRELYKSDRWITLKTQLPSIC